MLFRSKHFLVAQVLGSKPFGGSASDRGKDMQVLKSNTEKGKQGRKLLKKVVDDMHHETHALGTEFGQRYTSAAVFTDDEKEPFSAKGREAENSTLYYEPCTYPGRRLPHAWLRKKTPGPLVSTIDLAGNGRFALFTGIGGHGWKEGAERLVAELGIPLCVVEVGRGLEWEDAYLEWEDKRGVDDDGCVLVRPDFFVAWRSEKGFGSEKCYDRLGAVITSILGF